MIDGRWVGGLFAATFSHPRAKGQKARDVGGRENKAERVGQESRRGFSGRDQNGPSRLLRASCPFIFRRQYLALHKHLVFLF